MSFVIRRKSDGKFFTNPDYSTYNRICFDRSGKSTWTDSVNECKPFKTIGGAKASRGWPKKRNNLHICGRWMDTYENNVARCRAMCPKGKKFFIKYLDTVEAIEVSVQQAISR